MSLFGNIIWLIFGGIFIFFGYVIGGIALCMTIIGIPWGFQCFKLAIYALLPFGSDTRRTDDNDSSLNLIMNIIWLIFGGLWGRYLPPDVGTFSIHNHHRSSFWIATL